jgi:hypothetical protein
VARRVKELLAGRFTNSAKAFAMGSPSFRQRLKT